MRLILSDRGPYQKENRKIPKSQKIKDLPHGFLHSVENEDPILTCASDLLCEHRTYKNQKVAQLRNRYHRYRQNAVQIDCSTKGLSKSTKIISMSNKKVLPGSCVYISMSFIF